LKKLLEAGLIEKAKNFFWSPKGRKIDMYKVSNKSIVISPRTSFNSKLKALAPVAIASIVVAFVIRQSTLISQSKELDAGMASSVMDKAPELLQNPSIWPWFLGGAIFAILLYLIFNWKKL
jgi:hypothetical protein